MFRSEDRNVTDLGSAFTPEQLQQMEQAVQGTFWDYIGCQLVKITQHEAIVKLAVKPHHMNMLQIVNGGVTASLLDNAMGVMAYAGNPDRMMVTSQLNINYVAPLKGPELYTYAHTISEVGRSITCYAEVRDADGTVGAYATATFRAMRTSS